MEYSKTTRETKMKYGKLILVLVLLSTLLLAEALQARPQPGKPADYADKQAAWLKHQELVANSPYAGLQWRSVGPVVQGGRLVDMEVVRCIRFRWAMENHQ
jgi:hypothetical protein